MRILYVITSTDTGGAEKTLVSLVQLMCKKHTVCVVSLKQPGTLADEIRASGAQLVSLEMTGAGLGTVAKLVKEIETFKPDLVHAILFRAIEFARLACAGRKIKLITTPHFDWSQKPLWMRYLDRTLKNIDTISSAESATTYNYLIQKQHYLPQKTILLGNAIEKSLFFKDNSIKKAMRAAHGFTSKDIIFISVARLAAVKNPLRTLESFSRILPSSPYAKFVFVGDGPLRKELQQYIKENKLEKHVFLVGEQHNVNDWLNMADVFVLLSIEESLPLALLEAQQVGLACLVSRVGDMPARVEHGKDGFVCNPKDEILMSCLFAELYENKTMRKSMGSHAQKKAKKTPASFQQYQHLYQQIVNK